MKTKKLNKKILAVLMTMMMCMSGFQVTAFADVSADAPASVTSEAVSTDSSADSGSESSSASDTGSADVSDSGTGSEAESSADSSSSDPGTASGDTAAGIGQMTAGSQNSFVSSGDDIVIVDGNGNVTINNNTSDSNNESSAEGTDSKAEGDNADSDVNTGSGEGTDSETKDDNVNGDADSEEGTDSETKDDNVNGDADSEEGTDSETRDDNVNGDADSEEGTDSETKDDNVNGDADSEEGTDSEAKDDNVNGDADSEEGTDSETKDDNVNGDADSEEGTNNESGISVEEAQANVEAAKAEVEQAEAAQTAAKGEADSAAADVAAAGADVDKAAADLTAAEEAVANAASEEEAAQAAAKLEEVKAALSQAEAKLAEAKAKADSANASLAEIEKAVSDAKAKLEAAEAEAEKAANQGAGGPAGGGAGGDKADSDKEQGDVTDKEAEEPEEEKPEEKPDLEADEEAKLQAFIDAAAQLPETVTEENYEAVEAMLENLLVIFGELTEEQQISDGIMTAYTKALALWEQVEGVKAELLALNFKPAAKVGDKEYITLQQAVDDVDAGAIIQLIADFVGNVTVSKSLTFDLNGHIWTGRDNTTLKVTGGNDVAVTVKNGTMKAAEGFDAGSAGSVIHAEKCDLTIENCTFDSAVKRLVQVASTSAKIHPNVNLTIKDSNFSNASYAAVYAAVEGNIKDRSMKVDISNTTFENNVRGLYCSVNNSIPKPKFDVNVTGSTFEENSSAGISIANNANNVANFVLNVENTNFRNNTGSPLKMASFSDCATVNITGGEITGNKVSYSSDSVIKVNGPFTMDGTKVSNNTAYLLMDLEKTDSVTIKNADISDNEATVSSDQRGAIYISANANANVYISGSTFTGNSGRLGGALYISGSGVTTNINNSAFKGNTAKLSGGAIYFNTANGIVTIADTVVTDNTANSVVSKTAAYGYIGGGLYVANTTGTVTLSGTTRVYNNHTPGDKQVPDTNDGGSADIVLASTTTTSSSTAKNPDNFTRATLNLECETSFIGEDGNTYTLTQFDRKLLGTNGWYYPGSGSKYSWPMGYYTVVVEPVRVYVGNSHKSSDKAIVKNTLAEAVAEAKNQKQDTVYVCDSIILTQEVANILNTNSDITFARCAEHPNGHMFTINGTVTLNGAHINGLNLESDASLIFVPSSAHLTIAGDTIIENGKNTESNGGAIQLSQSGLTMIGGTIYNNYAKQGGGIYAYSNINGSKIVFEGGTISNNTAKDYGGGAFIGYIPSEFGLEGGRTIFDGNTAYMGGGIYLDRSEHHIYRADFTNNTATRPGLGNYYTGGGIYIEMGTVVYMKNVYVSHNRYTGTALNAYAALGICPTGVMAVLDTDGLLSVDNGTNGDIAMSHATTSLGIYAPVETNKDAAVIVADTAPGGGNVRYSYGEGIFYSGSTMKQLTDDQYKDGLKGSVYLKTEASKQTKDWAKALAENNGVLVIGNKSDGLGSGIMTNGALIIGTDRIDMGVEKKWVDANLKEIVGDSDKLPAQIIVSLARVNADGTFELVNTETRSDAMVMLNKENNWSYTWKDLDPTANWSVAEASVTGWKLWKVEETGGFTTANPADSYTFLKTEQKQVTAKENLGRYGHIIGTWTDGTDSGLITAVYSGNFIKIDDDSVNKADAATYYRWKLNNNNQVGRAAIFSILQAETEISGELYLLEVSGSSAKDVMPNLSEDQIKQLYKGSFNYLKDADGNTTGYLVNIGEGSDKVYYKWEATNNGSSYQCTEISNRRDVILTNKESDDFHELTFSKSAEGFKDDDLQKGFTFKVEVHVNTPVIGENGKDITKNTYVSYTIDREDETDTIHQVHPIGSTTGIGIYKFNVTIKAGEKVTISGLQYGDEYIITEIGGEFDTYVNGTIKNDDRTAEGKIENDNVTINFLNLQTKLTVQKKWNGAIYIDKIKVQLYRNDKTYGDPVELTNESNWEYTWKNLQSYDNQNSLYTYRVEELPVPGYNPDYGINDGKALELTDDDGKVIGYGSATITNTPVGSLKITKNVIITDGGDVAADKEYIFTIRKPDGTILESVSLKNGEHKEWKDIPLGIYTVTEDTDAAALEGYKLEVDGTGEVEVEYDKTSDITITNTYDKPKEPENPGSDPSTGSLTIIKTVQGVTGDLLLNHEFRFTVTGPEGYSETVTITGNGSKTLDGLKAGTYTVTEDSESTAISGYVWNGVTVSGEGVVSNEARVGSIVVSAGESAAAAVITFTNTYRRPSTPTDPGDPTPPTPSTPENPPTEVPDPDVPLVNIPEEEPPLSEIPEEEPPLANIPDEEPPLVEIPEEEPPLSEIPDEEPPLADMPPTEIEILDREVPKTGDTSATLLWIVMSLMALFGMGTVLTESCVRRRRK